MSNYNKVVVTTPTYSVTDMAEGSTPICDTKILSGSSWNFNSEELPATVYYESTSVSKPKTYVFASDSHHVEMSTNRTLEEEYTSLLGKFGKEIDSPDGSAIQVNDGISGKVLKMSIKGQTVKNEFYALPNNIRFSNGMMVLSGSISGVQQQQKESTFNKCIGILKPNTVYSVVLDVIETNYTQPMVFGVGNTVDIDVSTTGIKVGKFTTPSSVTGDTLITLQNKVADQVAGRKIAFKFGFYEGDLTIKNPIKSPKFGLSSTQAIISNNCEPYPIYANEEDETNKKVISLNKVGDMADTLEIKSDGSGVWTNHLKCEILTNELNYRKDGEGTNTVVFAVDFIGMRPNTILADKFVTNSKAWDTSANIRGVANSANSIFIQILKSELSSYDVQGFKEWLKTNTINVIYQLATPTVTHLDKSIVPAILTHKTNILEAGGAVKPSSFKVTVPTTDGIKKEYTLTPINGWKGTAKANLLQTGDIGLVLDLTIPSSFNASVCSLATELRPKAERTVLGYNGNTPVVVKIGTDGTVKLPVTATGVVKLDDTYKL